MSRRFGPRPVRLTAVNRSPFRILLADYGALGNAALPIVIQSDSALDIDLIDDRERAIDKLQDEHYDCAIIDCTDGDGSAKATVDEVRRRCIDTPVIVVVGPIDATRALLLLQSGAADCVTSQDLDGPRLSCAVWNAVRTDRAERSLERAKTQLAHHAMHDGLTGLPNRSLFFDRLDQATAVARREGSALALLRLDINAFDTVNKNLGHDAGDTLLQQVAERLAPVLRRCDFLARIGDDEFAITLPAGASLDDAEATASNLLQCVRQPFVIDNHTFTIGASIGIAVFPVHAETADRLSRRAESAMRSAKRNGAGFVVYAEDEDGGGVESMSLGHELLSAIENDELVLHYQPKISMLRSRVCGVEALLRWQHPRKGMIFPDAFIPLAEQSGLIEPLTQWVIDAALEQCEKWRRRGLNFSVSVNLSAKTLHNTKFPNAVQAMLTKWGVPAASLMLEITESAIIGDVSRATETVTHLHNMGVGISIDDFGTGYTSLSYLRKLPVREIKVDKSFVMSMAEATDDLVIVGTLIELGHNLGLQVVAEGVENAETWDMLRDLGCNIAQGFYMSRPVEADSLDRWLVDSPWGLGPIDNSDDRRLPAASLAR